MSRWLTIPVLLILTLLLIPPLSFAQTDPPSTALLNAALADLSSRAGTTVTLDDLSTWSWTLSSYSDASLGCAQSGQSYAQVVTSGYRIEFIYGGVTLDYRATPDGATLFLCTGPATITVQPTAAPTWTPAATSAAATAQPASVTVTARTVCADAMDSRLKVGDIARVRAEGLAVNLRQQATSNSTRVEQITPGETFTITGGPTCAESLVWWAISHGSVTGWIGEGSNGIYWIEPTGESVVRQVTATPATAASGISEDTVVYALPEGFRTTLAPENAAQLTRQLDFPIAETVTGAAWSPDGVQIIASAQSGLRLYNLLTFRNAPRRFDVPDGPTTAAAFSPDGTLVASAHNDTIVRVWDISTGSLRAILRGHTQPVWAVAFSPDGTTLASGGGDPGIGDDSNIRLWDINSRTQTALLSGHTGAVTALAFSPDGTQLASGGLDGTVRFWEVASGSPGTVLTNHNGPVRDLVFMPDGSTLISVGDDGSVHLWRRDLGTASTFTGDTPLTAVAITSDGSLLATGGSAPAGSDGSLVQLWDMTTGTVIATLPTPDAPADATVAALAFDPNAVTLVEVLAAENSGLVRLWTLIE